MNKIPVPNDNVNWTNVVLESERLQEQFQSVKVVTTKSVYVDKILELALDKWLSYNSEVDNDQVLNLAKTIIQIGNTWVQESIEMVGDEITVSIDVDVIDDEVVWCVLDRVYQALSTGVYIQPVRLTYSIDQLQTQLQLL